MRVTPHQNVLIYDIDPADQAKIDEILITNGVEPDPAKIDTLVRYSMACPALPTCGLAVTESERVSPSVNERFRALLTKLSLPDEQFVIRMTGCPNGCARPYMAEVGFVGIVPETYQVWLAGCPAQTRLAQVYTDKMHIDDLETFFTPILTYFKQDRKPSEGFGDFCDRVGLESIREVCKH